MSKLWSHKLPSNRISARRLAMLGALSVSALLGGFAIFASPPLFKPPQASPVIATDKAGYLAGERITISGAGFAPFENVNLLVTHADGSVAAETGSERRFVSADAGGNFNTAWSINASDTAGVNFAVTAAGASGSARAAFSRIAV